MVRESPTDSHANAGRCAREGGLRTRVVWLEPRTLVCLVGAAPSEASGITRGLARRLRDESAGRHAALVARCRLVGRFGDDVSCSVSFAHSEGFAAAIASCRPGRIGVDLIRTSRLDTRALRAIATAREVSLLSSLGSLAPAAAWAIKEATLKAFGAGQCRGLTRIRITKCGHRLMAGPADAASVAGGARMLPVWMWRWGDWLIVGVRSS